MAKIGKNTLLSFSALMGVDFVGVGGYGNYLPFLHFAKFLNIPWLILSDGEDTEHV
jgi:putative ATP-dependent endonuclease of OLD family